jgi:LPPG:FO 2-phospho-L-lactate transferase
VPLSWELDEHPAANMKVTALAGGIGASKFLVGLMEVMPAEDVTVIVNTGDDIELFGLRICPDLDTVTYTLAGLVNQEAGWGLAGDTFESLKWVARYGEASWFKLGDRDLATHLYRTSQLRLGNLLTEITDRIRFSLGVRSRILPMNDAYTPTKVVTDEGEMHFQEYFVRRKCEPRVKGVRFDGIELSQPSASVLDAILGADVVVVCPSNPVISIGPILAVPGVRDAIRRTQATVAGITPIIGGRALKGPAADMLRDLGHEVSAAGVAKMYRDFVDIFVVDEADAASIPQIQKFCRRVVVTNTVMTSNQEKRALALRVMEGASEQQTAGET